MMTGIPEPRAAAASAPLADCLIGVVPIVWNNADLPDLAPLVPAETVLDEIARLGFDGCQTGVGFPSGDRLRAALGVRGLRLAEVYAALPCSADGPARDALAAGRARLAELHAAGGDVLVAACDLGRDAWAGRAADADAPRLTKAGLGELAALVETLGREARDLGHRLAFHQHTGTFIETPDELDALAAATDPDVVRLCLDIGHYTVAGGDPATAIERHRDRVAHVHVKDVAAGPLEDLRSGRLASFLDALRARIFAQLGDGVVDLAGVLAALARIRYHGWLMVEQDTSWAPASESAAVGRQVLRYAIAQAAVRPRSAVAGGDRQPDGRRPMTGASRRPGQRPTMGRRRAARTREER